MGTCSQPPPQPRRSSQQNRAMHCGPVSGSSSRASSTRSKPPSNSKCRSSVSECAPQNPRRHSQPSSRSVRPISPRRRRTSRPNRSAPAPMRSTPMSTHENRTGAKAQTGTLWRIASTRLPTRWGIFEAMGYERDLLTGAQTAETALALVLGDPRQGVPLLRVHSQCLTGEMPGSLRCDCGGQLELAMQAIAQEGRGLVIYEYQEGRGIGLMAKLQAYELQDAGIDTVEANHALGFKADFRDFSLAAAILHDLRIP